MLALVVALALAAEAAAAQKLYKYQDAAGTWVFSDRRPETDRAFEVIAVEPTGGAAGVRVVARRESDGTAVLVAENSFQSWVQIAFALEPAANLAPDIPTAGNRILPPESETELLTLRPADPAAALRVPYRFQFIHGHPGARHRPDQPYRLPYALANSHTVTQAFPDIVTHNDPGSTYAIDFEMPIGTGVYAAREGSVIEVASDYFEAGLDPELDGPRANIVRILHEDGTFAIYGHLNWNSIRVVPGQRVARGEYIADSGNTGFSSGPHLHFVVQRNAAGRIESVPVEFAGPGGVPVTLATGDSPVAY
jgi:murein DD-endopeptidase MepM/ murein hydrolase activator NlpD